MTYLAIVFIFLIISCLASIVLWTVRNGISPMPTAKKVKRALLTTLPPACSGHIYELGSAWGTLALALAKKYPQSQIWGYETSPIPYFLSRLIQHYSTPTNLTFVRQDFFAVDLSKAKLIVCYLYPTCMQRLKAKFEKELHPDTLVASHTFAIPGWKAEKIVEVDDLYKTKVYLYKIGAT